MKNKFAIFILSNRRANQVKTYNILKKCNCSYPIYIVLDDLDNTIEEYKLNFENILVFDKVKYASITDTLFNNTQLNQVTFARNAAFDLASELGLDYFWVLDDDILDFTYRPVKDSKLDSIQITNMDKIIDAVIEFLKLPNITSVCFADDSFYFGGKDGNRYKGELIPGLYNSMFFKTADRINFSGNLNEDLITLLNYSKVGKLMFMYMKICNRLPKVSTVKGGNYDAYKDSNNYIRTFYHIIPYPANCKVNPTNNRPIISHKTLYPKIISDRFKRRN